MPLLLPFIFLAPARHDWLRISSLSAFCGGTGLPIVVVGNAVHFGGRQLSLRLQIVPDAENLHSEDVRSEDLRCSRSVAHPNLENAQHVERRSLL
jgi:hypothetical protein